MDLLVSILIPAYNAEKWIKDTIESAINQSWLNKEIIIVNDGSKDSTLKIAQKYKSKFVKVINQTNRGGCVARNKALSYAQGDYIQWLDSDDLLAPDKIEKQLIHSEVDRNSDILLTSSGATFYKNYKKAKFAPNSLWQDLRPIDYFLYKFSEILWMNVETWLISRKLVDIAGPWNESLKIDQDGEYICRVVAKSEFVKFIRDSKSFYRIGNVDSTSMNKSYKASESYILAAKLSIKYLLELENSSKTKTASLKFLNNRMPLFLPDNINIIKEAMAIAADISGKLTLPSERTIYELIRTLFGGKVVQKVKRNIQRSKITISKVKEILF